MPRRRIRITHLVLPLLLALSSVRAAPPADETMEACSRQLDAIGKALAAYERDHHKPPDQLSDLYPRYVPNKTVFHCPADPSPQGDPGRGFAHRDPKMATSYTYEFSADESRGLPTPLGPFPKADVGNSWGTCRQVMTRQADFFGDQVPVVRCFHHKVEDSDDPRVINLTRSGLQYRSTGVWEDHVDSVGNVLERAARSLASDGAEAFRKGWDVHRLDEYLRDKPRDARYKSLAPKFGEFASRLSSSAKLLDGTGRQRVALRLAARCFSGAGEHDKALAAMEESMRLSLAAGEYAPGTNQWGGWAGQGDLDALVEIYHAAGKFGHEAALLAAMHRANPGIHYYVDRLAEVNDAAGAKAAADKWRDESDPGRMLVSRPAPDFSLPTPSGGTVSLKDALKGRKALLVNFWFYGCGPCRAETPHLQRLYSELKDKGLGVVAIDLGDTVEDVRKYIAQFQVTFPVALGGTPKEGERSVFGDYGVSVFPTNFLIDKEGKVAWHSRGFDESGIAELRAELDKLGVK